MPPYCAATTKIMQPIHSETSLANAILELENRQAMEARLLKVELQEAFESIKPVNLIKNAFGQVAASSELKGNLLNTVVGLGAGFLTKAVFTGISHSPVKRLIGNALMFGITNLVAKHPEFVKSAATGVLKLLKRKRAIKAPENGHDIDRKNVLWT